MPQYQPRTSTTPAQRDGLRLVAVITVLRRNGHTGDAERFTTQYLADPTRVRDIQRAAERRMRELGLE